MIIINKSLSTDFNNELDIGQLHHEIVGSAITITLIGINLTEDLVEIMFESTLPEGDVTILNSLIENHVPNTTVVGDNVISIPTTIQKVATLEFKKIANFIYRGSDIHDITNVKISSSQTKVGTSYTVRVFDVINGNVIAINTFTNTNDAINDLGAISNLPSNETKLELQAKVSSLLTIANIDTMSFYY
jgi:hypothetical protein